MDDEKFQRKLAAIFHADVVGYSKLMRDDEMATVNTISEYRELDAIHARRRFNSKGIALPQCQPSRTSLDAISNRDQYW